MGIEYKIEKISSRERINAAKQLDPKEKNKIRFFLIRDKNGKKYFNEKKKNKIGKDFLKNKKKYPKNIIQLIESCAVYSKRKNSEPTMPEFFKYFLLGASVISFLIPTIKSSEECLRQEQIEQTIIEYKQEKKKILGEIKKIEEEEIERTTKFYGISPLNNYRIRSGWGRRKNPMGGPKILFHYGLDMTSSDRFVKATQDGTVISKKWGGGYGLRVLIEHKNGFKTLYAHFKWTYKKIKPGYKIKKGENIGEFGKRGRATGPHLHYEVWDKNNKKINPRPHLKSKREVVDWELQEGNLENIRYYWKENVNEIDLKYDSTINYINKCNLISLLQRK